MLLIAALMVGNYPMGLVPSRSFEGTPERGWRRAVTTLAIVGNLGLLGYFKYICFFSKIAAAVFPIHPLVGQMVLPLRIPFFTFEAFGYIVDGV